MKTKVSFFQSKTDSKVYAVQSTTMLSDEDVGKLVWALNASLYEESTCNGVYIGPRVGLVTPWSSSAVDITRNANIHGIIRIEEFEPVSDDKILLDPMLKAIYNSLGQDVFDVNKQPDPILHIDDIAAYNKSEGLALSDDEVEYLKNTVKKIGRTLTDSEIFGFSQANSDHCRHKVFNGKFVIDGEEMPFTLFQLIKETTKQNPNGVVSAYKDNCALMQGPTMAQFAPKHGDKPSNFQIVDFEGVFSLKAETHNFPTTVEPFNGAATGSGGEIRDRMGAGTGSLPFAGSAVYMTSYPRTTSENSWEQNIPERPWLYQTPMDILIKASNGASDFGNKFGQPLINGGLLTFEHQENGKIQAYDKVIMMAGGIGIAKQRDVQKHIPPVGSIAVLLGGDNYRIGMGGGAVSSVSTGQYSNGIELNAVQRANPQMQKRAFNVVRAFVEASHNPIFSIHDHGAGGHFNCLSELVDSCGGVIHLNRLPIGDPTLSAKEIIGNESQERMGLVLPAEEYDLIKTISDRENCPCYNIGTITGDMKFVFADENTGETPIDMQLEDIFGNPPKVVMKDTSVVTEYAPVQVPVDNDAIVDAIEAVLSLEGVACKDWLTNKVDRSVTGRVALQQTCGEIQLPLNNLGIMAYDYVGKKGIATSIGFAPVAALVDPGAGSRLAIGKSLTNILWTPLTHGLKGVSLSANWIWPTKSPGEVARLYEAVKACSEFAIALGINIPTGKDSMSMTQKYKDMSVDSPGTVIISAVAETTDVRKSIKPVLQQVPGSKLYYIDFGKSGYGLGGSAYAQTQGKIGGNTADVIDPAYFSLAFEKVQKLVVDDQILAGHDISGGGLITTLLEMNFANTAGGMELYISESRFAGILFSENPGVVIQVREDFDEDLLSGLQFSHIGEYLPSHIMRISKYMIGEKSYDPIVLDINILRDVWFYPSCYLDNKQKASGDRLAHYKRQALSFRFPENFKGTLEQYGLELKRQKPSGIKAAIIREQGSNGDREMAWMMYLAGLDVRDVHMTDLVSGRETLEDVNLIVFVGGFSNSDVLGSAKGWAGAFKFNPKAKEALDKFYARPDTLSLGVCNGCQLMVELGLIDVYGDQPKMLHNDSRKFESGFVSVSIKGSNAVMLQSLAGSKLGIWVAHGEGKFALSSDHNVAISYYYGSYPANPNGSAYNAAGIVSGDGRHLAMMPHPERGIYPENWAYYPEERKNDEVTPWIHMFLDAKTWIQENKK
ncbi:TPA: phosphoribosylformylglycinamidine synthase [Patescibacteria group bacterium]|nr:phosphoribosylformylglycinamidine synthase [Candidatus Gracilibacteria bacterium]